VTNHLIVYIITVHDPNEKIANIGARMTTFKWTKCQLLIAESPLVRVVLCSLDVMTSHRQEWAASFRSPSVECK
jgi:hypothetical protein